MHRDNVLDWNSRWLLGEFCDEFRRKITCQLKSCPITESQKQSRHWSFDDHWSLYVLRNRGCNMQNRTPSVGGEGGGDVGSNHLGCQCNVIPSRRQNLHHHHHPQTRRLSAFSLFAPSSAPLFPASFLFVVSILVVSTLTQPSVHCVVVQRDAKLPLDGIQPLSSEQSTPLTSILKHHSSKQQHLSRSTNAADSAEYFYASDKLADSQVAHFVNSLSNHSSVYRPVSSIAKLSSSRFVPVFPTSPLNGVHTPTVSSSSSLFSNRSLPRPNTSSQLYYSRYSKHELPSNTVANISKQHSRVVADQHRPQPSNRTKNEPNQHQGHLTDLSWVQPVYVSSSKQTTKPSQPVRTDAFTSDQTANYSSLPGDNTNRTSNMYPPSDMSENIESTSIRKNSISNRLSNMTFSLKDEQWVAPIIALSLLNMMVIFGFECFVIYRACRTCPSRRHLFLGQMLLLGLFLSSAMGITFVPTANWLSCTIIRAGVGISYSIVYATLLVKTVFLLSLHSGVYLSAEYQALLLFFIISTQVAIDGQWLVHQSSSTVIDYMDGYGHAVYKCDHSINQMLLSLVYVIVLIVLVAVMAFRVRGYRENHGEALFIGITAICAIVLWLVWIAGSITSTPHYRDGFIAFGVVGNATMTFIIMFLPKGRQLAAVGREGISMDRDQLSTASSPSIYTPSFLHIKPVSQLIPMNKPNGGFSLSGVGGGVGSVNVSGYHLYKQFQGTGTTLTSPTATNPPSGPLPAIPSSYSSHAILSYQSNNKTSLPESTKEEEEDQNNDPNYCNLSNVFSDSRQNGPSNLNSPASENISSSTNSAVVNSKSSGQSKGSGGSGKSKHSSSSHSKSSQQHSAKSPMSSNADCFFYLQPPPLPPTGAPNSRTEARANRWRQSCFTSNYGISSGLLGRAHHYFPKSMVGRYGHYTSGVYHPALSQAPNGTVGTPMGPPPHLLSPTSDDAAYYFASFDASNNNVPASGITSNRPMLHNNSNNTNGLVNGHNSNFKYFRGSLY